MKELNLIRKIAWSFHYTTQIDIDELFSEACLAYCEILHKYDSNRGKITTYLWRSIHNHMKTYLTKYHNHQPRWVSFEDIKFDQAVSDTLIFDSLSPEAQQIAEIILSHPKPYICKEPKEAKERIQYILIKQGWKENKIKLGIHDLQLAFSNK
jgi:DNA-directed RNA polymerase specialized sigma subunit